MRLLEIALLCPDVDGCGITAQSCTYSCGYESRALDLFVNAFKLSEHFFLVCSCSLSSLHFEERNLVHKVFFLSFFSPN